MTNSAPDTTSDELEAQLALTDIRLRVANKQPITAQEYRGLILSLQAGRASRARAISETRKAPRAAPRTLAKEVDLASLFSSSSGV